MTVFTHRFDVDPSQDGPRLAVKCAIDLAGLVTHAGNAAVAEHGEPAAADAAIVQQAREAGAVVVGQTVMPEFGLNATGVNEVMGTPTNPLDAARVPGGSSSGSAVAVATEEADVAYGTDAGGSCRIPAACCGVAGLKPTQDRFTLEGVVGLTFTMDVAGPLARDVAGVVQGTAWMEPGFAVADAPAARIGRLRVPDVAPHVDAALDAALERYARATGAQVVDVELDRLPSWHDAYNAGGMLLVDEGWRQHGHLVEAHPDGFTEAGANKLRVGGYVDDDKRAFVAATRARIEAEVDAVLEDVGVLALPTIPVAPPRLDELTPEHDLVLSRFTIPFNLSGHPGLAMPVPTDAAAAGTPIPASLQLIGRHHGEELVLATGLAVEGAVAG